MSYTSLAQKSFQFSIRAQGRFNAELVFSSPEEVKKWITNDLPEIEKKSGAIALYLQTLDGLKVGDTCFVIGEGLDKFKIEEIRKNGEYRYSFGVNNCWESVHKCYTKSTQGKEKIPANYLSIFDAKNLKKLNIKSSIHF